MQPNPIYEDIINQLLANNYAVYDNFISTEMTAELNLQCKKKFENQLFKSAGIGSQTNFQLNTAIRKDKILWLDTNNDNLAVAELQFCEQISNLIEYLNQTCYLGLKSYELHYSCYEVGDFYHRHLDQFKQNGSRKLSLICYLNENWNEKDGGQLRIELENDNLADIPPLAGRLVMFWADKIWHQVLPTQKIRQSLTGWLKN